MKNKKPNQKRTLKDKIKNFFTIPDEVFEEEPSPKFEKVTLFTLTKNKLFLGILFFLLIINTLVGFDINYFYIRAVLGFIFLITIPGLLIMLMLKIREVGFWEYLVYTIGLSVSFIMFGGLAVNWILPWLNITDKPLSLLSILICFNIFLVGFWITAWIRNKDLKQIKIQYSKLDTINRIFFVVPMLFPVLSILGSFLLNNHGTNILTMIMLGGIAVYVFMIILFRDKLNENVFPWAILMMSISLLLMGWLRSWFVSGVDTNLEFYIFQLIKENQYWSIQSFYHAYNACLSITILPTIFDSFLKINNEYIFKLLSPLIFSVITLGVYLFLKRYTRNMVAFMATFFFISQPIFMAWASIPLRQEISFLFFTLSLLVLFSKNINPAIKKTLFLIFSFSMIVSHYSTSYIALAIFTLTYILTFFYQKHENKKIKKGKCQSQQKQKVYLTKILIIVLIIFSFLWLAQLTETSNGIINFTHKTFENIGKIFTEEVRAEQTSIIEQFNIFYKPKNPTLLLQDYAEEVVLEYKNKSYINKYPLEKYEYYNLRVIYSTFLPLKISLNITSKIFLFGEIIKKLVKIFILVGVFYLLFSQLKKRKIDIEYIIMALVGLFWLVAIMILPFASIEYDLLRTYQQTLILLSLPATLGGLIIFKFLKGNYKVTAMLIVFLFYFLFCSGFIPQIIGGSNAIMQLNNFGEQYSEVYVHKIEIESANWLYDNFDKGEFIYADKRAVYKFWLSNKVIQRQIMSHILPFTISKDSYVYSSYTNSVEKKVFTNLKERINHNFPTKFLNINKNKIYNNGGSEIFK